MSNYDDYPYDDQGLARFRQPEAPHSMMGIASLVIGALTVVWEIAMVIAAGVVTESGDPEEWVMQLIGLAILGGFVSALIGLILGFVAVALPNRKKLFGFLGIGVNCLVFIGICGLIAIGLMVPQ